MKIEKYEEKVKYLSTYRIKKHRCIFLENILQGVKSPSFAVRTAAHGNSNSSILDEKSKLESEMIEIERAIRNIDNSLYSYILEYKFIYSMTLEEIAFQMNYSLSQIKRYYRESVNKIILNKKENVKDDTK